jgi:protein involved in polysaccharide export with SLBB domain
MVFGFNPTSLAISTEVFFSTTYRIHKNSRVNSSIASSLGSLPEPVSVFVD